MKQLNLVLVTSVIRSPKESFHITEETRLEQTIKTIATIKEKIPNPYIVLIEGGPVNDKDKNLLVSAGVNDYRFYDVSQYSRSGGELKMLCNFFFSDRFKELRNSITSVSKISGRYFLNDKFVWKEGNIIKKDDVSWSGKGACSTRFYKITSNQIDHFCNSLKRLDESIKNVIDIEHGFYQFNVVPFQDQIDGNHVGVTGFVSPLGIWEDA